MHYVPSLLKPYESFVYVTENLKFFPSTVAFNNGRLCLVQICHIISMPGYALHKYDAIKIGHVKPHCFLGLIDAKADTMSWWTIFKLNTCTNMIWELREKGKNLIFMDNRLKQFLKTSRAPYKSNRLCLWDVFMLVFESTEERKSGTTWMKIQFWMNCPFKNRFSYENIEDWSI